MGDNRSGKGSEGGDSTRTSSPARSSIRSMVMRSNPGSFDSPMRHHTRKATGTRIEVKETLNARSKYTNSQDDGTAEHYINQYLMRQEIGRGSFGAVHLAVDRVGREYAVKEFSKARLRKRAQSHFLRHPRHSKHKPAASSAGQGFNSPLHRNPAATGGLELGSNDQLYLIRQEIAIMKKLQHHNLVSLFEVLDDPTEDSLYMVMELCKQGVVMKVGLGIQAEPYDDEKCRHCFRDLLLGVEYLHAQGIAHRDIKPDNCLLTSGGVLKVVDFGVSEMFEKDEEMYTAKFAGSPAFLPPELCVAGHGDVSGRAADIWSMGVTLYCLKYGRLPFEKPGILELYESIRTDEVILPGETDEHFIALMHQILEKDPEKRIKMPELREHPWVTRGGVDPLLSEEENTAVIVPNPTDEEVSRAITNRMRNALHVVKAVNRWKKVIESPEERRLESIFGQDADSQIVQPPELMNDYEEFNFPSLMDTSSASEGGAFNGRRKYPLNPHKRTMPRAPLLRGEGSPKMILDLNDQPDPKTEDPAKIEARNNLRDITNEREKQASRDNSANSTYLFVGPSNHLDDLKNGECGNIDYFNNREPASSSNSDEPPTFPSPNALEDHITSGDVAVPDAAADQEFCLSESPSAADDGIYEIAYRAEIQRIRNQFRKPAPTVYLTRRVEDKPDSEALLKMAHHEGAVISAPSNNRRMTSNQGFNGVSGADVQSGQALAHSAQREVGSAAPIRGKRSTMTGERFKGALQKLRKGE